MQSLFDAKKLQAIINEVQTCKMTKITSAMLDFLLDHTCTKSSTMRGHLKIRMDYEDHCAALDPAPAKMLLAKLLHLNKSAN